MNTMTETIHLTEPVTLADDELAPRTIRHSWRQ